MGFKISDRIYTRMAPVLNLLSEPRRQDGVNPVGYPAELCSSLQEF